jgi:hypothetical protein
MAKTLRTICWMVLCEMASLAGAETRQSGAGHWPPG